MFLDTVSYIKQQLVTDVREGVSLVPVVRRKPKILRHWLLGAHKPQLIILALFILVPMAVVPLVDWLLSVVFSPVTEEMLFGLLQTKSDNPYLPFVQGFSHWVIWIVSVLLAIYLYLRHIPITLEQARGIAYEKEVQADELISVNPSQSVLLYVAAREWCVDEQSESAVDAKLNTLNTKLTQVRIGQASDVVNAPDATVTMVATLTDEVLQKAIISDRYQIIDEIGSGAMGTVYLAEDLRLNRPVALKQLSPLLSADRQQLARFRQEALVLARLSHPNIVQVYDFVEWNNLFLIAIEYVDGGDLGDKLKAEQCLEISEVLRLAMQMSQALAYAHKRGVVHRDLKPANILMTKNGDAKISDFGIAKFTQSSIHTQVNTVMGSPAYMSPEQANGESTDERTDIYSFGIMLYQMFCGERPFNGDTKSIISQHLTKLPPDLCTKRDGISSQANALVQKMLRKDPAERYQSVDEFIEELNRLQAR